MRKSEQFSVAIFLAVALFAGTIAGSSAPAFVVDAQATEDKRDYKEKDKYHDKDSRYDDNKKYDGHDDYSKYDRENKYSKYDRENRDGHDDDKSVKYVSCQNININGKSFQKDGGDGPRAFGGMNSGGYGEESYGEKSYGDSSYRNMNHDGKFPGKFIKETYKDVTVICIQNNDGKNKTIPEPQECEDCFKLRSQGGAIPFGLQDELLDAIDTQLGLDSFAELCDYLADLVEMQNPVTTDEAEAFLEDAWQGQANPNAIERLIDCLLEFDLLEESPPA
jgi:hypothetical protein